MNELGAVKIVNIIAYLRALTMWLQEEIEACDHKIEHCPCTVCEYCRRLYQAADDMYLNMKEGANQ
jgi:hypothetical protein